MAPPTVERTYSEVVGLLRRRGTYDDRPGTVHVLETHISCVFVTDRWVYKLKKPVHFEFVDFSKPDARRQACEDEVRLNRRLAPDVYQGVVPIVRDDHGELRLGGAGQTVDYVVKMRRLDTDQSLDALLRSGRLADAQVDGISRLLATFYGSAAPLVVRPLDVRQAIEAHVRANRDELIAPEHELDETLVQSAHAAQFQYLLLSADALDARACDGRIVDGHGDLRPEHIVLEPSPVVFDCLEFDARLRHVDVVDDLSFLAMECDRLGAPHVGQRILEAYVQASGDRPPAGLVDFYKCYRACVRSKVAALRAKQLRDGDRAKALDEARDYLALAARYARSLSKPLAIVVGGLMGSGKSTLAESLASRLGATCLSTDRIRRGLFGASDQLDPYGAGAYAADRRRQVYDELLRRAGRLLERGLPVVMDGTFLAARSLTAAAEVAERSGARLLVVRCVCPVDVAKQRIAERAQHGSALSEARPELYERQASDVEPCPPSLDFVEVDTTEAVAGQIDAVVRQLRGNGVSRSSLAE